MTKRDEILERAADRRRFRIGSPQPIKLKGRALSPFVDNSRVAPPLTRKDLSPKPQKIKPAKPAKVKKDRPTKAKLSRGERTEVMRQGVAARWIEDRPMPDPTVERCPGSGQSAATVEGYLLTCGTCGQKLGVAPPFTSPEHNREKQP